MGKKGNEQAAEGEPKRLRFRDWAVGDIVQHFFVQSRRERTVTVNKAGNRGSEYKSPKSS